MNRRFSFSGKILAAGVAAAVAGVLALPVLATTPGETVKLRQETMKQLGGHMKAIKEFAMEGQGTAQNIAMRADEIGKIAAKIPSLFPEGTSLDAVKDPKTGAKPAIWADWAKFEKAAATLGDQSKALQTAASGGDRAVVTVAFQSLGKNGCGNCHEPFRLKLEK